MNNVANYSRFERTPNMRHLANDLALCAECSRAKLLGHSIARGTSGHSAATLVRDPAAVGYRWSGSTLGVATLVGELARHRFLVQLG